MSFMNKRYKKIDCDEAEVLRQLGVPVYTSYDDIDFYGVDRWTLDIVCNEAFCEWDWYVKLGEDDNA